MTPTETIQRFLDEIKAYDEAATEGPWFCTHDPLESPPKANECVWTVGPNAGGVNWENDGDYPGYGMLKGDGEMAAFSRTALPKAGKVIETMLSAFKNHLDAEWDCMNFEGTLLEKEIARIIEEK